MPYLLVVDVLKKSSQSLTQRGVTNQAIYVSASNGEELNMQRRVWLVVLFMVSVVSSGVYAGQRGGGGQCDRMDYGPYLASSVLSDPSAEFHNDTGNFTVGKNQAYCDVTARGISIRLTDDWNAGMVFDADACRMSAGWLGGPPKFRGLIGDAAHGPSPTLSHPPVFQVLYGPG